MSMLSSFFHPGRGYDKGQQQLDKYYGQAQGYLDPYNQQGIGQAGNLNTYINSLMDPQALQDKWIKDYKESEAAKNAEGMAQEHGLDAASGLGLMGSGTALDAIQSGTSKIGLEDRQNYLNDLMEKYKLGAGLSQGMYGTGANAAGQMGQNANQMGQNSAEMAYGKQNAGGNLFGKMLGGAATLGGTILGGPIGGAIANKLGSSWSTGGK